MRSAVLGGIAIATFLVSGCGDDTSSAGDVEEYCRLSAEADQRASLPSGDEISAFLNAAPAEIRGDVQALVNALNSIEDPEDAGELVAAFEDPDVVAAIERLEEFEAENCD